MAGISEPLLGFLPATKSKLIVLGSQEPRIVALMKRACSLNLEHVSPVLWKGLEISRRPGSLAAEEATILALLRRWFFARKPDAGFVVIGFPATLLQAKVLDEWLEARNEALSVVIAGSGSPEPVVGHYASHGLLREPGELTFA